jgi:cell division protein FtsL
MLTHSSVQKYPHTPRSKKRGRAVIPLFLALFLLVASLIFLVWSRFQVTHLGYQISQAINEQKRLLNLNKQLKVEGASLRSLSRIEGIATSQLGLTNPEPQQMVHLQ